MSKKDQDPKKKDQIRNTGKQQNNADCDTKRHFQFKFHSMRLYI